MATLELVEDYAAPLFRDRPEQLVLFAGPPAYSADCLVCGLPERFPLRAPRVCGLCLERGLAWAYRHVARLLGAAVVMEARADLAWAAHCADLSPERRARLAELVAGCRTPAGKTAVQEQLGAARWAAAVAYLVNQARVGLLMTRCEQATAALRAIEETTHGGH